MGERPDPVIRLRPDDDNGNDESGLASQDAEVQQTREEMSETLDAIQAKLAPDRLTEDAKDAAIETVDHVVAEVRSTAQELSELASVAAMEAVDHALEKFKEAFPGLSQQAQEAAREAVDHALGEAKTTAQGLSELASVAAMEAVDHAIEEAKTAVRDLGQQTKAAMRDATIGRVERMANTTSQTSKYVGSTTIQTIKQNPGPAALTALGVGWLVMNGKGSGSQSSAGQSSQTTLSSESQPLEGMGDQVPSKADQVQETAGDVAGQVQDGVSTAATQVQETATQVASQVQDTVSGAAGHVKETAGSLATQAKQAPNRFRTMIGTNPLPLGLLALALGGVAALVMPETQREHELLGEARDSLIDRAQAGAQTVMEKVQHVTEEVGETVEKEAKYQGLTPADN
ncbi:MAG: DUF3618 domain-containing protein [Thermomicrobiales bacterium]